MTPLDWVFQHWSPRNVTSSHNDCLTKRAVGELAVGKQARKYSLIINYTRNNMMLYRAYYGAGTIENFWARRGRELSQILT